MFVHAISDNAQDLATTSPVHWYDNSADAAVMGSWGQKSRIHAGSGLSLSSGLYDGWTTAVFLFPAKLKHDGWVGHSGWR